METSQMHEIFINRELSWLEFNRRVLDLAKDRMVPVGEQLKFASIYSSNLDEFFMVRVGSLFEREQDERDTKDNKTGMTPAQQLDAIFPKVAQLQQHSDKITERLFESIRKLGYQKVDFKNLNHEDEALWKRYFIKEVFPLLSPQIVDRRHPFPFLQNQELYIGMMLRHKDDSHASLGLVPIGSQLQRIVFLQVNGKIVFALTEEMTEHFADIIFGKNAVRSRCIFRVTRSADITVDEALFDRDTDYREVMSKLLEKRRKLAAVRLQASLNAPKEITDLLCRKLKLSEQQVFRQSSPLDMSIGFKIAAKIAQSGSGGLFYPPRRPMLPPKGFDLIRAAEQQDVLLSYPYQSIRPFLRMLQDAAQDPDVVSIKMTLYRMAHESKIVEALISAAENGKEVLALVELRARFDEQNNIDYSKQLEEAGCTVIYGFEEYKIHSKLTLITRRKAGKIDYISQIGTGNYNEKTSEQYTDLSFITTDFEIGTELSRVFSNLAVERLTSHAADLLVAPLCFKSVLMEEMDREIRAAKEGRAAKIIIKCNSVSDREIIEKICEASCAGVPVQMIVRGICCIRAGVPGLTENVTVRSIVGRYLEHERVYVFGTDPQRRVYIASGDFLTRNTERRVEAGVRIQSPRIAAKLMQMLELQLADNVNAREMRPDGTYAGVKRRQDDPPVDSQLGMYALLEHAWEELDLQTRMQKTEKTAEQTEKSAAAERQKENPVSGIPVQDTGRGSSEPTQSHHTDFAQAAKRASLRRSHTLLGRIRRIWNNSFR